MSSGTSQPGGSSPARGELAQKLAGVAVMIRQDLEFTRHVFQQVPTYVVRDPVTFATHRFSVEDYDALAAVDTTETLGEAFDLLVEQGAFAPEEEDDFYNLILYLHRASLLNLPFSDHAALFKRYDRRRRAKRLATAMSPFFFKVPIWNPDSFLDRTHRFVGWLFSWPAFVAWVVLVVSAGTVAFARREDLTTPLLLVLEVQNIPLLWLVLVVLKVLHEFGHAYACKHFGGKVPDMGAMFIVGTPAAYVDASAAWGFREVSKRMTVNLAGVYVESICAALAMFVWAATPPGLLNSIAYQVVIMASIVTLGFNVNPLAKFDGYYVVADLAGIPNLRQRASEQLARLFNRFALGLPQPESGFGPVSSIGLVLYACGATVYRVSVVLGLSAVIASKLFVLGLALAVVFLATTAYSMIGKAVRYLVFSETTAPVRGRAIAVGAVSAVAIVALLLAIPTRSTVRLDGVIARQRERTLFAAADGFVESKPVKPGPLPPDASALLSLENPQAQDARLQAAADLRTARLRVEAAEDPAAMATAVSRVSFAEAAEHRASERLVEAVLSKRPNEMLLSYHRDITPGERVTAGEPIARLGSGEWVINAFAKAESVAAIRVEPGDTVECRSNVDLSRPIRGTVLRIAPAADRAIDQEQLTQAGGGPILIDAESEQAREPYVQITVRLENPGPLFHGTTAWVRVPAKSEPLVAAFARNLRRFTDDLSTR